MCAPRAAAGATSSGSCGPGSPASRRARSRARPPDSAAGALQVYVHGLRRALGAERIERHGSGYRARLAQGELDLDRFEGLVERAERALVADAADDAAADVQAALELWRGPALADLADEPLGAAEAGPLEDSRLRALELRNETRLALGEHGALVGELERLIADEPYRERLRGQLMLALYRSGRQTEALAAYRDARGALVDQLGIEPSEELHTLEKQILRHDQELQIVRPQPQPKAVAERAPVPVERKLVTILFADLGITDELEEDPERAQAFLDQVHREAEAEIAAAGGSSEKGIAGALLATFGAPAAHQDAHAVRAAHQPGVEQTSKWRATRAHVARLRGTTAEISAHRRIRPVAQDS